MKYVILKVTDQTSSGAMVRETPIIFGEDLIHADVADAAATLLMSDGGARQRKVECVAAGFLHSTTLNGGCYGKSTSLNINSREERDDELMRLHDYYRGMKL